MAYKKSCTGTTRQCNSQVELFDSMNDSILINLLDVSNIEHPKYDPTKFGGIGWISIHTNDNSGFNNTWSQLNTNNTHINMLVVNQYSKEDSKLIFNTLSATPIGTGIVFDHQGNLALLDSSNKNKVIYNPLIAAADRNTVNLDATDVSQTIRGSRGKYMLGAQGGELGGNVYFISTSIVMNPHLTFILYTKEKIPTENSIYYLLYNPIHRKAFQDYYRSLLEYNAPPPGWEKNNLVNPGSSRGYQDGNVQALSQGTNGTPRTAPGFRSVIAKYCNAFRIGGVDTLPNGFAAEHYADPACTLALSAQDAQLAFILSANYTQANLAYRVWASENGTKENGKKGFLNALKVFQANPGFTYMYWPCETQQSQTAASAYNFCRSAGVLEDDSTSFLLVLANAYVNSVKGISDNPVPLNRGASGNNKKPECKQAVQNIITCQNNLTIAGDAEHNKIAMTNACNPLSRKVPGTKQSGSSEDPSTDPSTTTPTTPTTPSVPGGGGTKKPADNKFLPILIVILILLFIFAYMYFK